MTDSWIDVVSRVLADYGPWRGDDGLSVELRSGSALVSVFRDPTGKIALAFAPEGSAEGVLAMRASLPVGIVATAERRDNRVALVVRMSQTNSSDEAIAGWARAALQMFEDASASSRPVGTEIDLVPSGAPARGEAAGTPKTEPTTASMDLPAEHPERTYDPALWAKPTSSVARRVVTKSDEALRSYASDPLLIDEHANKELGTAQGGYGRRQIYELVQNAADELLTHPGGMIKVLLTDEALYCANEGSELTINGVNALLMSDLSVKRGNEIGRFGLGFKSVLAITHRPVFLSRSGSFRFDPDDAAGRIRAIAPNVDRVPSLRTAVPIDPQDEAAGDKVLRELMAWATTVVKLPRDEEAARWLHDDLAKFPAEFLLFSPHVARLVIEDRTAQLYRQISVSERPGQLVLTEDGRDTEWSIFRRDHRPSKAARADAGEIADREVIPVIWAVRQSGQQQRGTFWAFFPTSARTTLSGIINAPWKTNSDRQNLLPGDFNEELVAVVADLVVENLERLAPKDDPGHLFDILPARGRESPSWADQVITDKVYEMAAVRPCLPDQTGVLCTPSSLRLPPAGAPSAAVELWAATPGRPSNWLHSSASETTERRSKAERLFGDRSRVTTFQQWLEALVESPSPAASVAALRVAQLCRDANLLVHEIEVVKGARVLLTSAGDCVAPDSARVFFYRQGASGDLPRVHPDVQADERANQILHDLGFHDVGLEDEYRDLVKQIAARFLDWDGFWAKTAELEPALALAVLDAHDWCRRHVKFRTVSGGFHERHRVLLPGGVVNESGDEDAASTIDIRYHEATIDVVRGLGIKTGPIHNGMEDDESWLKTYREAMVEVYDSATSELRQRPAREYLEPTLKGGVGPLAPMLGLSTQARQRFTEQILAQRPDERPWQMTHISVLSYPAVAVLDPTSWFVRQWGVLPTSLGGRGVALAVGPALEPLKLFLPVVLCTADWASKLDLPDTAESVPASAWKQALEAAAVAPPADAAALYAVACRYVDPPVEIRCSIGDGAVTRANTAVFVTADRGEHDIAVDTETPILFVANAAQADLLVERWGLTRYRGAVDISIEATPAGDPIMLGDAFASLRPILGRQRSRIDLLRCDDLRQVAVGPGGRRETPIDFAYDDGVVYWRECDDDRRLLEALSREFNLGLSDLDFDGILQAHEDAQRAKRLVAVREAPDPASKLLVAVGRDAICQRLSQAIVDGVEETQGPLDDLGFARLASGIYGIDLFKEFKGELISAGFNAPDRWAGSQAARHFVLEIGLPRQYAGYEDPRLDPLLDVDGPSELNELHQFQEQLTVRIRALLKAADNRRAILSLPTGAGKTRVTVEALIRAVENDGFEGPILWTAPTKELCEQAVQTWADTWRAMGPGRRLHLSRFWGTNQVDEVSDGGVQVVVATEDKLLKVINRTDHNWLAQATVLIVDEAHGSTETGYTQIFHWLGLGREQSRDRCSLIGLTATPFKGSSVEGTERLRKRYGQQRLDEGILGDNPHETLQEMRVLARAKQRVLGGSVIDLTEEQAEKAKRDHRLPQEVEERLGEDKSRNRMIIETVLGLDPAWKILIFATSVAHAKQLAAILNFRGVKSAVIHADTNAMVRRHYVTEFNKGDLRVLTNYGVLAEGFDAPSVRTVIVARPTLSPGVYQQMIGRGLRGPLNGGKDECLIVNVADNIVRYGLELAFKEFEYPAES